MQTINIAGKRENPKKRIRRLRPILQLLITYKEKS